MRTIIIFFIAALTLASCRSQDLIRPGDTLEVAFEKSMSQYNEEKYSDAARAFETVISIGRGTDIGQDAQYYLAESYFQGNRYLMAASEYSRYVQFHPTSPRREEVEFKEALCYYHLSPRAQLDQTYTNRAIDRFRLFRDRYPDSEWAQEVSDYIDELREKLAQKEYSAARHYMTTSRYNSAAIYFGIVIDNYPETSYAERALVRQIEAYILYAENSVESRQEERFEKALGSYNTFLQLFPQGDHRSRAEDLYDRATRGLDEVRERIEVAQN